MLRRPLHLALLLFQILWLNVIVPGHTRGIVQLPGTTHAACGCEIATSKNSNPGSPADRTKNCAICFFAAHLSIPPTLDFTHTRLDFLHRLSAILAEDRVSRIVLSPFDSRGPPAAA